MSQYHRQVIATAQRWDEVAANPDARGHIHPAWWEGGDEGYESLGVRDALAVGEAAHHFLGVSSQWRILDVGCGDGRVLIPMARFGMGQGEHGALVGLDTSEKMLYRLANDEANDIWSFTTVQAQPGRAWPEMGDPFDVVYSFNLLIHLPSQEKVATLARIYKSLRPGGVAAIQLPLYSEATEPLSWTGVGVWTPEMLRYDAEMLGLTPHRLWAHDHPYEMGSPGEYHHLPQILLKKP